MKNGNSEYPVKAGDKPTIKVTFKPDEAIGGGAITVSVKKLFVPLGSLTVDICSQMGLACPLTPGQVRRNFPLIVIEVYT